MSLPTKVPKVTPLPRQENIFYREREHLEAAEVLALIQAAGSRGRFKERDSCLILLIFRHGFRASEATMLKWDAIDLESKQIKVNRKKKSHSGIHPLQPDEIEALNTLKTLYPNSAYVFPAERGEHVSVRGLERMFTRVAEFVGLKIKVHPHMLRHSCASFLLDQGMPIQDIQKLLGHVNVQNTIGYLPVTPGCFNNINWNWSQDK